jgi:hypothetical protein
MSSGSSLTLGGVECRRSECHPAVPNQIQVRELPATLGHPEEDHRRQDQVRQQRVRHSSPATGRIEQVDGHRRGTYGDLRDGDTGRDGRRQHQIGQGADGLEQGLRRELEPGRTTGSHVHQPEHHRPGDQRQADRELPPGEAAADPNQVPDHESGDEGDHGEGRPG